MPRQRRVEHDREQLVALAILPKRSDILYLIDRDHSLQLTEATDKKRHFLVSKVAGTIIVSKLRRFLPDSKEESTGGVDLGAGQAKKERTGEPNLWRLLPLERLSKPP